MTKLLTVFDAYDSEAEALASFSEGRAGVRVAGQASADLSARHCASVQGVRNGERERRDDGVEALAVGRDHLVAALHRARRRSSAGRSSCIERAAGRQHRLLADDARALDPLDLAVGVGDDPFARDRAAPSPTRRSRCGRDTETGTDPSRGELRSGRNSLRTWMRMPRVVVSLIRMPRRVRSIGDRYACVNHSGLCHGWLSMSLGRCAEPASASAVVQFQRPDGHSDRRRSVSARPPGARRASWSGRTAAGWRSAWR